MNYQGLSNSEVIKSREQYGENILTQAQKRCWWKEYLEKFTEPLIVILLIAGILSIAISVYDYYNLGHDWKVFFEPVGIFIATFLATTLSFLFESRANKAFNILNKVNDDEPVDLYRNGVVTTVPRKDVVVGDIVIVNTGDEIPADGVILEMTDLSVDESMLTGEPLCHKSIDPENDSEATYPADRLLKGTKVMEGHGIMKIDSVGDHTEMGTVYEQSQIDDSVQTPLNEQLGKLGKQITKCSYIIAVLIIIAQLINFFVLNGWTGWLPFLSQFLHTIMIAVTLIVVSVPEGLPMAVTLSLAYSMSRMLKTNNLVRKMHACETMGATTVICTDKTGTLTQNMMQVYKTDFFGEKDQYKYLIENMALNSTAQLDFSGKKPAVIGNPTEGSLLVWLESQNIDYLEIRNANILVGELPFSTERKYMATIVQNKNNERILYVKGAPEIIRNLCCDNNINDNGDIDRLLSEYQNKAMRTLGFAYKTIKDDDEPFCDNKLIVRDLQFLGITAISDPVRPDVAEAINEVNNAGVKVKIVTGDTPSTAKEIARQIGLWNDSTDNENNITTGTEVARLSDEQLKEKVESLKIIARARPLDKKRLVEALQANGEVVAVTGDGTNDAPALKTAHVGLSMGDGTSVAKEASDITIIDNSFSSIGRAVMWGRSLYKNIQRFLLFQLTVNVAACFLVLVGSFFGAESPLSVTQMLWVNLIMDTFGAMALASLPPSKSVMKEKPRRRESSILTKPMIWELVGVGLVFFIITFGFYWLFLHSDIKSLLQLQHATIGIRHTITTYDATLLFSIFVWLHFWYMFNSRCFETDKSIFQLKMSKGFWTIVLIIIIGQLFITEIAYDFFNVAPMIHTADWKFNQSGTIDLLLIISISSMVLWTREIFHAIKRDKYNKQNR